MEVMDINGGNAEVAAAATAAYQSNLESEETPEKQLQQLVGEEDDDELDSQTLARSTVHALLQEDKNHNQDTDNEINGDLLKTLTSNKKDDFIISPSYHKKRASRKLRHSTANSSASEENEEATGLNVSISNSDKNPASLSPSKTPKYANKSLEYQSEEEPEFYGFDLNESRAIALAQRESEFNRFIEQEELQHNSPMKRRKLAMSYRNLKNADSLIDEIEENTTTDSDDHKMAIDIEHHTPPINIDESSLKSERSVNSSISATSNKSRKSRSSRGASPSSVGRGKVQVDLSNPLYKVPFRHGWRRELVYRSTGMDSHGTRRMADIYYYTPEGKKVRSFREVADQLHSDGLTVENFTFFKEPIGINDPSIEIIRDAKKGRDSIGGKGTPKTPKILSKKPLVETPVKKASPKRKMEVPTPAPSPPKTSPKILKSPVGPFKVKLPTKKPSSKSSLKKEFKILPVNPQSEPDISSPTQWSTSPPKKVQQPVVERVSPPKVKKLGKKSKAHLENDQRQNFMLSVCAGYHSLSRIFQYLKVQELLRAARVCRMWRDLAAHPSLWKTVRLKNNQVTDWEGLADTLKARGTQHLDLRKMLIVGDADNIWKKFVTVIPRVTSLVRLELCRCPAMVVEEIIKSCPQLHVLSALSIKCDKLNLNSINNLTNCSELRLKALNGMLLEGDLTPLLELKNLVHLSLTSIKDLGKQKIEIVQDLTNLETLELGECSDFPEKFGTTVLINLKKLERLRLEKGQGTCCTFDILDGISQLEKLNQLELVNFDVKNGFDKYLANCKNIKRLLIIPTYISQSATSNNMILGGVTQLSNNLSHFIWGVTQELLRVTELFVDQCNQSNKQVTIDSIPVLKPVPCLKLIESIMNEKDPKDSKQANLSNPQIEILSLPNLQKLLLSALPKTRTKILKIPFHATWRQSFNDSTNQ